MNPVGVAVSPSGNLYVAERLNARISKFTSDGEFLAKWGTSGSGDGQFAYPTGVIVDAAFNVYVVEEGNNRVQKFDSTGTFLHKWSFADGVSQNFAEPWTLAVDADCNVYVTDRLLHSVSKFDSAGTFIRKWGTYGFNPGQFRYPTGIAVDRFGRVYVTDNNNDRVQVFTSDGAFIRTWGSFGNADGKFHYPYGIDVGADGSVYVADHTNYRMQEFDSSGGFLTKWGSQGSADGQFNGPVDVAVDAAGSIYVADEYNHRIQKFSPGEPGCWGVFVLTDPQAQVAAPGASASFSVSAGGNAVLSYRWQKYCTDIAGATDSTYTISSASPGDAGPYRVIVSNSCGVDTSAVAALVLTASPTSCSMSGWIPNGRAMHQNLSSFFPPSPFFLAGVTDGAAGVLGTWSFGDAKAFRVDSCGQRPPGWTSQGNPLAQRLAQEVSIASDQQGGAIVAFISEYGTFLHAQRVLQDGTVHPSWPADGRQLTTYPLYESVSMTAGDSSGAFVYFASGSSGVPYLQRVTGSGIIPAGWPAAGLALSTSAASNDNYTRKRNVVPDGSGGAYASWMDDSVRVQRVTKLGQIATGWRAGGLAVGTFTYTTTVLVADDAGGVYVVWNQGSSVLAQRLTSSGEPAAGWPASEVYIGSGYSVDAAADGAGGLLVTWQGGGSGMDIWARRVAGTPGSCEGDWPGGGTLVCGTAADQLNPTIIGDGDGGAYVAWEDYRNSPDGDIYTHRVTAWGALDPTWPSDGRLLCGQPGHQRRPLLVGSGAGDAIALWQDYRSGVYDEGGWNFTGRVYGQLPWTDGTLQEVGVARPAVPLVLGLSRPRPNPARGPAAFDLKLARAQSVSVTVSDVAGRTVRVVAPRSRLEAGQHVLAWDLRDGTGALVPSGLYFIRARSEEGSVSTQLIVVR